MIIIVLSSERVKRTLGGRVNFMMAQRLRRWAIIKPTLGQRFITQNDSNDPAKSTRPNGGFMLRDGPT